MRARKTLLWLLPAALLACAVVIERSTERPKPEAPPRPTVNHALHAARELVCADCHDPEETGDPKLPEAKTCFDCHEQDLSKENERVQAYFASVRQPDGEYRFARPAYMDDLIAPHATHAEYEVTCAQCHGEPSEAAFARPDPLESMNSCMECHRQRNAANECATCHEETRKETRPSDHDAAFRLAHGKRAPEGWRDGKGESCAICHSVPQDCQSCHTSTKPASHQEAGFRLFHGHGDTDVVFKPFEQVSCALCHEEQSCVRCHQTTKPRSHTTSWERRFHGIGAGIERQSCQVCHKQDFCASCHQTAQPVSHRGSFATGPQAHCLHCHEPLAASTCFVCHKNTRGHLQATPLPPGPPHTGSADCLACHLVLPHFDDGGSCRRCHR